MAYALWAALHRHPHRPVMTGGATPMQVGRGKGGGCIGRLVGVDQGKEGESSDEDDNTLRHTAEEIHEMAANLLLLLAVLHVAGVFVEARAMRRNLVAPMLLGKGDRPP
jgi:cytochrome b